jgi:hypothetical protein
VEQGNLYILPADEDPGGDPKDRAHLVVSLVDPLSHLITLAYCSTQSLEAGLGSPHVLIDPARSTFDGLALPASVLVCVSAICSCYGSDRNHLDAVLGKVIDDETMHSIDDALVRHFFGEAGR